MEILKQRIFDLQEQLGDSAGQNPLNDRFISGAIGAYKDLLNIEFDEVAK